MATLVDRRNGSTHALLAEHIVGRGGACQLSLDSRLVSSAHAQLRWTGTGWEIHDLDSRNGTFVDGRRLEYGERLRIRAGVKLSFGALEEQFELVDDSPPVAHAVNTRGQRREIEAQLLVLPDSENPKYTIFERGGRWIVETSEGDRTPVIDGEALRFGTERWTLHLPKVVESTASPHSSQWMLEALTLRFSVSRDQEHIELTLLAGVVSKTLSARVHMEFLLRLAEARLHDRKRGVPAAEEGWLYLPELLKKLGIPDDRTGRNLLCQHICRARKQLASADVGNSMDIVQRRRTIATEGSRRVGQIRIGVSQLEIA